MYVALSEQLVATPACRRGEPLLVGRLGSTVPPATEAQHVDAEPMRCSHAARVLTRPCTVLAAGAVGRSAEAVVRHARVTTAEVRSVKGSSTAVVALVGSHAPRPLGVALQTPTLAKRPSGRRGLATAVVASASADR